MKPDLSIATILARAFDPPDPGIASAPLPPGSVCAITGEPITEGVAVADLVTDTTARPHEIFRVRGSPYVSTEAARCFKAAARKGAGISGNLLALVHPDGRIEGSRPMVSRDSAEAQGRTWWADVLLHLPAGLLAVAIVTDESRKRLWLQSRASVTGPRWTLYLHAGDDARCVTVDLERLRACIDLCTDVRTLGFGRRDIAESLFRSARSKEVRRLGFGRVAEYERRLAPWRGTDELAVAVAVVQPAPERLSGLTPSQEATCPPPKPPQRSISIPAPAPSRTTSAQAELFA